VSASLINDPKHWRDRAKEARAIADEMKDPDAKQMMLGIARDYVLLAERAEARAKDSHLQSRPLPAQRPRLD
jgi:hypothetical protein